MGELMGAKITVTIVDARYLHFKNIGNSATTNWMILMRRENKNLVPKIIPKEQLYPLGKDYIIDCYEYLTQYECNVKPVDFHIEVYNDIYLERKLFEGDFQIKYQGIIP
jgi:hypothetical protein